MTWEVLAVVEDEEEPAALLVLLVVLAARKLIPNQNANSVVSLNIHENSEYC